MDYYPYKCCRCGFCCLAEACPSAMLFYRITRETPCPALTFNDYGIAHCALVELGMVPIGDGCCIKARVIAKGIEYDFASLPADAKQGASKGFRMRNNEKLSC